MRFWRFAFHVVRNFIISSAAITGANDDDAGVILGLTGGMGSEVKTCERV